ncbi:MAG: hypothetical protein IT372_31140 [Polyangiaceae bacterium]|nr:hypothetical protein [Polyangiaceae bacterium]
MRKMLLVASAALALAASAGCGDDSGTGGGASGNCFDYGSFDGSSPAVTFSGDVGPILDQSCALSMSCHGGAGSAGRPYIGSDAAQLRAQNIAVPSSRESRMNLINPSDPAHSFLMHKIDGTFECDALLCGGDASCGTPMPPDAPLDAAGADTIRRWIAQGAQDN